MRRLLLIFLLFLCTLLILKLEVLAKRRPFIRGVFLTGMQHCEPSDPNHFCCPGYDYPHEYVLLHDLHANHITAWDWPERAWMDSVCNYSIGTIKKWSYMGPQAQNAWNWESQSWRDSVVADAQAAYISYGQDIGLFGYFVGHEIGTDSIHPDIEDYYPGFNYMCWVADSIDTVTNRFTSMIMTSGMITSDFPTSVTHLDYVETEFYPYGSSTPPSGEAFQVSIDSGTIRYDGNRYGGLRELNTMMNWFKDDSVSWMANIQASAWDEDYKDGNSPFGGHCVEFLDSLSDIYRYARNPPEPGRPFDAPDYPDSLQNRYPSREEIRLEAFLAISRGAKGLRVFTYGTGINANNMYWGLLDFRDRSIFHPGATHPLPDYYPDTLKYCYRDTTKSPYGYVSELYRLLAPQDDLLTNLYVTAAGSYRQNRDSTVTFIKGVRCSDSATVVPPGFWWEASAFYDSTTVDSTKYFMLINRITCNSGTADWEPAGYRTCHAILTWPEGYAPRMQDIFSDEIFIPQYDSTAQGSGWWTFTDSVGPGDGNLYRVDNIPVLVGPIDSATTLEHDVILTQDLEITSTGRLTIAPGVTVYIYPDTDAYNIGRIDTLVEIICDNGGYIYAAGTSQDSIRFIPWKESVGPGEDWGGIYIDQNDSCSFSYCSIRKAVCGIETRDNSDVKIEHSTICDNSQTGLHSYKGYLSAVYCNIKDNGIYGVYGLYSDFLGRQPSSVAP